MPPHQKPFGEVIESSLSHFLAQSWQWDHMPVFGSLIAVQSKKRVIFGLVHQIQTGSMDPVRYPFPYRKTHEELLAEQPQIFEFLKTTFTCLPLGYQEMGKIYYLTPPEPPLIHAFITPLEPSLSKDFFSQDSRYLPLLFRVAGQLSCLDDLLLALLKQQQALQILSPEKITSFAQTFSLLTANDYLRLKLFLQRAQGLL